MTWIQVDLILGNFKFNSVNDFKKLFLNLLFALNLFLIVFEGRSDFSKWP